MRTNNFKIKHGGLMKKVILLLTLLLGLTLVSCQKDEVKQAVISPSIPTTSGSGIVPENPGVTEGGITPETKYVFSEDEVEYFNTLLAKAKSSIGESKLRDTKIDRNNLSFTFCVNPDTDLLMKAEVKKINNVYLLYETMSTATQVLASDPFSALSIKELTKDYLPERQSFEEWEKIKFEAYFTKLNNPKLQKCALEAMKFFEIDVVDMSGPGPRASYRITIWKDKGKYVALDKTGVISTQDNLAALLADPTVNGKIAEALK